jgi:phospholipase C
LDLTYEDRPSYIQVKCLILHHYFPAEQNFLVNTINRLQSLPEWNSTAIIITYDDSGGWYDHVLPPIVSQSNDPANDGLLGNVGLCGHAPDGS